MKNTAKALCVSILCAVVLSNSAIAAQKDEIKSIKKQISAIKIVDNKYTNEYLELQKSLFYKYNEGMDFSHGLEAAQKYSDLVVATYGESSREAAISYLYLANQYNLMMLPYEAKKYFDKVTTAYEQKLLDKNTEKEYLTSFALFNNQYEQNYKAASIYKKLLSDKKITTDEKIAYTSDLINGYLICQDYVNAKKELNNLYNIIVKEKKSNPSDLINYYLYLSLYYQDTYNYKQTPIIAKKAEALISKLKNKNEQSQKQIQMNLNLAGNYNRLKQYDKFYEIIQNNKAIADEINYTTYETDRYDDYIFYYLEMGNYEKAKEYLNKKLDTNKQTYTKSSIITAYINETSINYYSYIDENKKAEKLAEEVIKNIDSDKESAPVSYAHFLGILADKKNTVGKSDEALKLANQTNEYYIKGKLSPNSIKFYETEFLLGNIYFSRNELDNALTHYKKAEKIANTIFLNQPNDKTADIYSNYVSMAMSKGDLKGALKDMNKLINIKERIYGANNIEVLPLYLQKANIYNGLNEKELAEKLYNKVEDIVSNNKHVGNLPKFYREYYLVMSYHYNELGNKEKAINLANKALEYTFLSKQKKEIKNYISELKK